jgi:hypothetical protein
LERKLIHPVRNDAPLEFLTGFISKNSRIAGLEGKKWKAKCGLGRSTPLESKRLSNRVYFLRVLSKAS